MIKYFFIRINIIAPAIALISDEILVRWCIIEIRALGIIPLIKSKESAFTYYIVQIVGSVLVLLRIVLPNGYCPYFLLFLGLTLKLGSAPFHFWVRHVYEFCGTLCIFLISTLSKIPMYLILCDYQYRISIYMGALTALVGAVGGLGRSQLRILLGYSSIGASGWILASTGLPQAAHLVIWGHILYSLNLALVLTHPTSSWGDVGFSIKILSLAGLPPLPGFFPKRSIIYDIRVEFRSRVTIILVVRSVIALAFYFTLLRATIWDISFKLRNCYSLMLLTGFTWYFMGWVVGGTI